MSKVPPSTLIALLLSFSTLKSESLTVAVLLVTTIALRLLSVSPPAFPTVKFESWIVTSESAKIEAER